MRLGGNTLRGSNPRSSALTSSYVRALRLGGLLLSAFRGLCVAIAAIRPPVDLIRCPRRGPGQARNPGRPAPITSRPAVLSADGSPRARGIWSGQRRPSARGGAIRDRPRQRIRVCGCAGSCLMCSRSTVAGQNHSQRGADRNAANWRFRALSTSTLPGSKPGSWALSWYTCPYGRSVVPILIRPPLAAVGSHAA